MYSEKEAAKIFKQVMYSIAYCHSNNIVHRDLKPENLLYSTKDEDSLIKVIDFGLSQINRRGYMKNKVGTAYYVAPEVLMGQYNQRCDIWSAGVILYILLCGDPPFNGPNDNEIYKAIIKMHFSLSGSRWNRVSKEAKDLIAKMLSKESERPSAKEVLEHPWFKKADSAKEEPLDFDIKKFEEILSVNRFKKIVLTFIASRLNDTDVSHLRQIFEKFDTSKDGSINFEELKEGLKQFNLDEKEIQKIFDSMDTDHSGKIDYTEFIAATIDQKLYLQEQRLFEAFKAFDKDNSGKISKEEIMKILQVEKDPDGRIEKMVNKFDKNGDGEIDYNEFLNMMVTSVNTEEKK